MRALGWAVAAVALGLVVLAAGLEAAGFDAVAGLSALWLGAFGSWDAITSSTLVRAVPLILIGLGISVAFRGGAFNIGAEGQFYAGAIAATWAGLHLAGQPAAVAIAALLLAATAAGLCWVAVPVWLKLRFGVIEVISTLLLNFVALSLVSYMVQGPLQERGRIYPQSDAIAEAARLPLLPGSRLHAGLVLALAGGLILWFLFARTLWGFRLRVVGIGPRAAEVSGRIDSQRSERRRPPPFRCHCGIGGRRRGERCLLRSLPESLARVRLYRNRGGPVGRLAPIGVIVAGCLFGALEAGAGAMQRDANIPAVAVYVVEAVVIVVALLATVPRGGWAGLRAEVRKRIGRGRAPG